MISSPGGRRGREGSGIFLLFMIVAVLMPVLAIMVRLAVQQSKTAVKDRNIRTAREMAESISYDYMQTFSDSWSRDSFDSMYTSHNFPNYGGIGDAWATLTVDRNQQTIGIWTVAQFTKGGGLSNKQFAYAKKGVNAVFEWTSDALKFDLVWPGSVDFSINQSLQQIGTINNTVFVNGNLDVSDLTVTLSGLWVVRGTFTVDALTTLQNARIFCEGYSDPLGRTWAGNNVEIIQNFRHRFVPKLNIVLPEGANVVASLDQYADNPTVGLTPATSVSLTLNPANYRIAGWDEVANAEVAGTAVTANYFPTVQTATVPWTLAISGVDVWVQPSVIARPITIAVLDSAATGGNVTVLGDITYDGGFATSQPDRSTAARTDPPTRTFALLAAGQLNLSCPNPDTAPIDTTLRGLYAGMQKVNIVGNRQVTLTGTLIGKIVQYDPQFIPIMQPNRLVVTTDRHLAANAPLRYPKRPRVATWDYVP